MCKSPLHSLLRSLPKCEHHMHLEGALTPRLLFKLASQNAIKLPADDPAFASIEALEDRYTRFTSLDDFLHYYFIGMSALVYESDFEALACDYFARAAGDGVKHAEVFFDPQAHLSRGVSYRVVLSGFKKAQSFASDKFGISSQLICCFLRHLPVSNTLSTFQMKALQDSLRSGDVTAIGLDSSEKEYPPALFKDVFREAESLGVRRTAHAGEEGPASYIREAIEVLGVQRIDHGTHLADDPELLQQVAESGLLITMCPISNVLLRCVDSIAALPIRKFLDSGVRFSINSDDPAYFGGNYILENYCAVQDAFALSAQEWEGVCAASIRGSWCGEIRKEELLSKLREAIGRWEDERANTASGAAV